MLFIDYSSAFNTIVPSKLVIKLETLGLNPALCNWVLTLNEWGRGAFILGHTRAQVCPISLTTLPAPPTNILLRKTRAKRKNLADRVGGSSQHILIHPLRMCV